MCSNILCSQFYIFLCELKNVSLYLAPSTTMIECYTVGTALDSYRKKNRNIIAKIINA